MKLQLMCTMQYVKCHLCSRVIFTVVSDPVDQEGDCDEVGTAEVDLCTVSNATVECTRHAVHIPGSCG